MVRSHAAKLRAPPLPASDDVLIARAEAAMARLSSHFAGWMQDECRRLEFLCQRVETAPASIQALDQLFRAAHDIMDEAPTFGYPLVERVAGSLCGLAKAVPDRTRIPYALVARHVMAVRRALRVDAESEALAAELEAAAARFIDEAGRGLDYPNVKGPPLVPGR